MLLLSPGPSGHFAPSVFSPRVLGFLPSIAGDFAEGAVLFDGFGEVDPALGRLLEEQQVGHLSDVDSLVRFVKLLGLQVPLPPDEPVVGFSARSVDFVAKGDVVVDQVVEFLIDGKQATELHALVGAADFLIHHPADVPQHARLALVVDGAVHQERDALLGIKITDAVIVEFGGHVEGQIPRLVSPNADKVRLQQRHLFECRGQAVPILFLLVTIRLVPEEEHRHATHAEGHQLERLAGGIDFPQIRFAQMFLGAHLRKLSARAAPAPVGADRGRLAQPNQRHEQHRYQPHVDHPADHRSMFAHRATSRVFRNKYPIRQTTNR